MRSQIFYLLCFPWYQKCAKQLQTPRKIKSYFPCIYQWYKDWKLCVIRKELKILQVQYKFNQTIIKEGQIVFEDEVSHPPKYVGGYPVVTQLSRFSPPNKQDTVPTLFHLLFIISLQDRYLHLYTKAEQRNQVNYPKAYS